MVAVIILSPKLSVMRHLCPLASLFHLNPSFHVEKKKKKQSMYMSPYFDTYIEKGAHIIYMYNLHNSKQIPINLHLS